MILGKPEDTTPTTNICGTASTTSGNLGESSMTYDQWETVDWKETGLEAIKAGVGDAVEQVRNFLHDFYGNQKWGAEPRKNMRVIRSYKRSMDKSISCRMRA
jgi:hypothetical protein